MNETLPVWSGIEQELDMLRRELRRLQDQPMEQAAQSYRAWANPWRPEAVR